MQKYEEAEQMTCTTSVERIGIKKGIKQGFEKGRQQGFREGLLAGIELGLALKFGITGLCLLPEIYKIENVHVLRAVQGYRQR